jgi:TRAP-type C4-dicarboxylate transport system permease small subunit
MGLVIPMMLLTSADVALRGIWSKPIPGAIELSSFMLAVFILTGLAYTHQTRGHVRVTMLTSRLPETVREALDIFTTILCLVITVIIFWQGIVVAYESSAVSDMLRISQFPFRLMVSLAALFLSLEFIFDLVDSIRYLRELCRIRS